MRCNTQREKRPYSCQSLTARCHEDLLGSVRSMDKNHRGTHTELSGAVHPSGKTMGRNPGGPEKVNYGTR